MRRRSVTISSRSGLAREDLLPPSASAGSLATGAAPISARAYFSDDERPVREAAAKPSALPDESRTRYFVIFDHLDERCAGTIPVSQLIGKLKSAGLHNEIIKAVIKGCDVDNSGDITFDEFYNGMKDSPYFELVKKSVQGDLVVPKFPEFISIVREIINKVKDDKRGALASYIPQLASVDPDLFGITIQTIDGQTWSYGHREPFTVQSVFLPVAYLMVEELLGADKLSEYIGHEPSGKGFQAFELKDGKPHNPMVSAGAILLMSLLHPDLPPSERFQTVSSVWEKFSGHQGRIEFDNSVYLSELSSADRNFALAHYMKAEGAFPTHVKTKRNLDDHLRFYFQNCSISCTTQQLVGVASTLANGGVHPVTKQRLFSASHVRNCLSLMFSCGMYDNSGQYAYEVGFPSKCSVSGAMIMVIPDVMGIAMYTPRIDRSGSPVIGMEFARELAAKFSFHVFDMFSNSERIDPTNRHTDVFASATTSEGPNVLAYSMLYGALKGDISFMRSLLPTGVSVNVCDVDGKTPLHLAAKAGNLSTVNMLLDWGADWTLRDRSGRTAVDEAKEANNRPVLSILKDRGAIISSREDRLDAVMRSGKHQRRQMQIPKRRSSATPASPRVIQRFASAADVQREPRKENGR